MTLARRIKRFFAQEIQSLDKQLVEEKGLEKEFVKTKGKINFCCIMNATYHGKIDTGHDCVSFQVPANKKAYHDIIGRENIILYGDVKQKPIGEYFLSVEFVK